MDKIIEHKTRFRKKHVPMVVGGVLAAVIAAWAAFGNHQATMNVEKERLTISPVEEREFRDYVRVSGRVAPIEVVQISAIEGGIVTEKCVEEGAKVRKGDVIVRLDNSALDLQILNAEAELAEKQNLLRNTQVAMQQDRLSNEMELASLDMDVERKHRNADQQTRLYDERLVAREDFLKAKEDYDLARRKRTLVSSRLRQDSLYRTAQMEQMEDNLAAMRRNVLLVRERKAKLDVRATIDGELGQLDVTLGQSIGPGACIGQINDLSAFRIEAKIDEHYIDRVHKGLTATFVREGKKQEVTVKKVFPEVREGQFKISLTPPAPSPKGEGEYNPTSRQRARQTSSPSPFGEGAGGVRPGQTFYLDLELGQPTTAVLIPRGTFFQTTGGQWIFVLSNDGKKAYRRPIRIGRQNPQFYEVLEGLEPGEKVITSGYEAFRDNEILNLE